MDEQPGQPAGGQPTRERTVNERAYAMWHEAGQPEGKAQEHWLQAEQEYDDYSGSASAPDHLFDAAQNQAKAAQ